MEITCKKCNKTYMVDDSKLPASGRIFLKCPQCKERIEVQRTPARASDKPPSARDEEQPRPPDYLSPDSKGALIYCQELQARNEIEKKLTSMDFQVRIINNRNDIRHYFRYNVFDLIVIYQHGPDPDDELVEIMNYIHQMPPEIRRKCLVTYIYISGNRYDLFDAFSRGVDRCLNPMDIKNLKEIIPAISDEKTREYHIFHYCKEKVEEKIL